jgi:hypothetical protein
MADIKAFIRKWNGRTLQDDGACVSKEFHSFQVAFMNAMRKIANSLGGELVNYSYGHYYMSGFIKRGNNFVYFNYDNGIGQGGRTHVNLKDKSGWNSPLLLRTARDEKDYHGGYNNYESFECCEKTIDHLLDLGHSDK